MSGIVYPERTRGLITNRVTTGESAIGAIRLRVGVVTGPRDTPTAGGAWTLVTALSASLKNTRTKHEYIFLDHLLQPNDALSSQRQSSRNILSRILRHTRHQSVRIGQTVAPKVAQRLRAKLRHGKSYTDPLKDAVDRHKLDIVWFMGVPTSPLCMPFIATVLDLEHRKQPYFPEVSVTGWTWEERERTYRTALPRASFVITGTQVGKEEIVHYYCVNPNNVKVVPFPVPHEENGQTPLDFSLSLEKYGISGDFLLYPAQFWPHKNHTNLLKALAILRGRDGLRLNLVFTGSDKGNRQHVGDKVREWELSEQVFDLGFVSREELNALYGNALALIFPSFFGPDNIPPLEAFALGCPVLASRIAGAEEQLQGAALLFDPTDPTDIADKVLAVTSAPALRKELVEEGRKIAEVRSPERYVAQIDEILDGFAPIRQCWGHDYRHP
jgi:glycosyltransferase involved in cell wall biosynthesis